MKKHLSPKPVSALSVHWRALELRALSSRVVISVKTGSSFVRRDGGSVVAEFEDELAKVS